MSVFQKDFLDSHTPGSAPPELGLELKTLGQPEADPSSLNNMYASLPFHAGTSASFSNVYLHAAATNTPKGLYINPLDMSMSQPIHGSHVMSSCIHPPHYSTIVPDNTSIISSNGVRHVFPNDAVTNASSSCGGSANGSPSRRSSDQIVQKLDDGLTTTWQLQNSPTSKHCSSDSMGVEPAHHTLPRSKYKHYPVDSDSIKSHSSSDSVNSQGSVRQPGRLKRPPFKERRHVSPSSGRKNTNYQLIPNCKTGN